MKEEIIDILKKHGVSETGAGNIAEEIVALFKPYDATLALDSEQQKNKIPGNFTVSESKTEDAPIG